MKAWLNPYFLYVLVILTHSAASYAQSFLTRLYTTSDGLADNTIYCISQDSYGYLWIGTANGLSRFDGRRFKNYGLTNGLPSLQVDRVFEDRYHRLWIGTRNGMAEIIGDSCYTYPTADKRSIKFVSGFRETEHGGLWALTDQGAYQLEGRQWKKIRLHPEFDQTALSGIVSTQKGMFINYDNRHIVWKQPNNQFRILASHPALFPYFNSLRQYGDEVYAGTYNKLLRLDNDHWTSQYADSLNRRYIYGFYIDSRKRFWFSTREDGIFLITGSKDKTVYSQVPLAFNLVSSFFEDREKNIWAACYTGLLKIREAPYRVYQLPGAQQLGMIRALIALPDSTLLVSGSSGKCFVLGVNFRNDPGNNVWVKNIFELNPGDFLDHHATDEKNRTWFVTRNGYLYRLDPKGITDFTRLIPRGINRFLLDISYDKRSGRLFVSADSVLLTGNENKLDTFPEKTTKRSLELPVRTIIAPEGSLLVQTLNNGLFRIDTNGIIRSLNEKLNISKDATGIGFRNDRAGNVWITLQGRGISKCKFETDQHVLLTDQLTEEGGLPDNSVHDFLITENNQFWSNTKKGFAVSQRSSTGKWVTERIPTEPDLKAVDLSFAILAQTPDGDVWVNSSGKLLRFERNKFLTSPVLPQVVIEDIQLYNRPTDWRKYEDHISGFRQIPLYPSLKYNENTLSITFNAIQYKDDGLSEYSYQLDPIDKGWSNPSVHNAVSFYRLSPGNYHFSVKARQKGHAWSEPAVFSFQIQKAFWETWWFKSLLALLASALILTLFRLRLNRIRNKTVLASQIRELEMKALKAQMNPHFIYNALNSIQSLILNNQTHEASRYISQFAKLLRNVLENSDKILITLDKELASLEHYIDLEELRMNMKVTYQVQLAKTILPSNIKIPPLILQPFVENALWHGLSQKEGDKTILLRIEVKDNFLVCSITDNGIGRKKAMEYYTHFPEGHLSKATAISINRLVEFNQGRLPEPVVITDCYENNLPAGTTVTLYIKQY